MKTTPAFLAGYSPAGRGELPPFNLILLHDHELAAKAARTAILRLLARPLSQTDVHQDQWTFEELSHSQFRNEALELAAACDMMILATLTSECIPFHVTSWIAHWSKARVYKDAAFVLLSASPNSLTIPDHLKELETAGKLALFASNLVVPEPEFSTNPRPRHPVPFAVGYNPRPERWGLNE